MKNISFAFFAILIAFVLFEMIKNIFFNKNQFSRRVKSKFFWIVFSYFILCGFGLYLLSIIDFSKTLIFINLNIAFFGMTLSTIFTTFRMGHRNVSLYDKWFYSARFKNEMYYEVNEKKVGIRSFYIFNISISFIPVVWTVIWNLFNYEHLNLFNLISYITFVSMAIAIATTTIFINVTSLGKLVRKNLLYNYLCQKVQQNNPQNIPKIGEIKTDMIELFSELFIRGKDPNVEDKNKQILNWIYDLANDGKSDKPMIFK